MKMRKRILNITVPFLVLALTLSFVAVFPVTSQNTTMHAHVPHKQHSNFTLSASATSLRVQQGGSNISIITITSIRGFNQRVDLTVTSRPIDGVTTAFYPSAVTPPKNGFAISVLTVDAATTAKPGNYTVSVTATSGRRFHLLQHSINIKLEVVSPPALSYPDFLMIAFPDSLSIHAGGSATSAIVVISLKGFNQPVNLTVTSPPIENVTAALYPSQVTLPSDGFVISNLTVNVADTAIAGAHKITVTGTHGALVHTVAISLTISAVSPPPPPSDFSITASPDMMKIQQGGSNTSLITITSQNGFSQLVDLAVTSTAITGATTTLNPKRVIPPSNASAISILTVDVATTTRTGSYIVTVTGNSSYRMHSTNITLNVTAPPVPPTPDFSVMASPATLAIEQGDSTTSTIIVASLAGFNKAVNLSITSAPITGVALTLNPTQVVLSSSGFATSTLKIDVAVNATPNQYDIAISGTSGTLRHSASIELRVALETKPPKIVSILRRPETPSYNESVTVLASVIDLESGVKDVILSYSSFAIKQNATMTLSPSGYKGSIPPFPYNTSVAYSVYASDKAGNWAKSGEDSYVVADPYPPAIGVPTWSPRQPAAKQDVTINVTVTKPTNASGIDEVTLWYQNRTMNSFRAVPMTFKDGNWTAVVSNQTGTTVKFYVGAIDKAGNSAESVTQEFKVAAPPSVPLAWILAAIIILAAAVGGSAYYIRRKQRKSTSAA
jgi:uncharacterized membrane protein